MTSYFQPLDLAIDGPEKAFLKKKFETWYSEEITRARQGKIYLLHRSKKQPRKNQTNSREMVIKPL